MPRRIFFYSSIIIFFMMSLSLNAKEINEDILSKAKVLSLQKAIARGIEKNLDLRVEEINIPIKLNDTVTNESKFDPAINTLFYSKERETPTATAFTEEGFDIYRETGGKVGIHKKFQFGMESKISLESFRSMNNSSVDALRPQYRSLLILNITQPLLRDLGIKVNTAELRISQNQVLQAIESYMNKAQLIANKIELAYYDLAEAIFIYRYRLESKKLAYELFQGNQKKFKAGVVPITEVQEAETALASRDEEVVFARQQVETSSNKSVSYTHLTLPTN